jgi:hypothetical protein
MILAPPLGHRRKLKHSFVAGRNRRSLGVLKKSKSINRKGRKEITLRTQRIVLHAFNFALFAHTLRTLRFKNTFSTAPGRKTMIINILQRCVAAGVVDSIVFFLFHADFFCPSEELIIQLDGGPKQRI